MEMCVICNFFFFHHFVLIIEGKGIFLLGALKAFFGWNFGLFITRGSMADARN